MAEDVGTGGGAVFTDPVVSAISGAFAGKPAAITGHVAPGSGDVIVEAKLGTGIWTAIATVGTDAAGDFSLTWKPFKAGLYDFRVTPTNAAVTAAVPTQGSLAVYRKQKATWYGPGFYGRRTACNIKLTKRTLGVAHRSLPCGTKVEFFSAGRKITVPVIDRGPYVSGVTWDLTLATTRALGSNDTLILGALPLP
jgi:hypothetical protein